jgi:CheY-like chemotaxis protein
MDDMDLDSMFTDEEPADKLSEWVILITDDAPDVHTSTKFALANKIINGRKLTFIDAYSGKEAIDIVSKRYDINLMLLDAVMETNDAGLKCAQYIKQELKREIPTIVMRTGFAGWEIETNDHNISCIDDFILKSEASLQKLISVLEKWLPKE